MLEWWADLNRFWKLGVAFIFLGLGALELVGEGRLRFWTWGIGLALLMGAILIGPTKGEKQGYRF